MNRWSLLLSFLLCTIQAARTVHRLSAELLPSIDVSSTQDPTTYHLIDSNLRPVPLLTIFDKEHFMSHLFPTKTITDIHNTTTIDTTRINDRINELLEEINQKRKTYTHFIILKQSGFVRNKKCGLLIVKFKPEEHLPFVVKLFIEPPNGFVRPYDKGFEASNFFIAGGALRHTLGFSRIKTLNYIREKVTADPYWHDKIVLPRKWFWLPAHPVWLTITTHNLGAHAQEHVSMPATYALIADELMKDPNKKTDYNELMRFSKFLEHRLDPHTNNFFIERDTGKIAVIDTELFPLILGFSSKIQPQDTHIKWYLYLASKYVSEKLFTTKTVRQNRAIDCTHYYLTPA